MSVMSARRWLAVAALVLCATGGVALTARSVAVPWQFVLAIIAVSILEACARRWSWGRGKSARLGFLLVWMVLSSLSYGGLIAPSAAAGVQSGCVSVGAPAIALSLVSFAGLGPRSAPARSRG
jgi:hypothetical protein